jgi:hypothetical protein
MKVTVRVCPGRVGAGAAGHGEPDWHRPVVVDDHVDGVTGLHVKLAAGQLKPAGSAAEPHERYDQPVDRRALACGDEQLRGAG